VAGAARKLIDECVTVVSVCVFKCLKARILAVSAVWEILTNNVFPAIGNSRTKRRLTEGARGIRICLIGVLMELINAWALSGDYRGHTIHFSVRDFIFNSVVY
jgi:hypothetical protein